VLGGKPHSAIEWLSTQDERLEQEVRKALAAYSGAEPDRRVPIAGHIWRICGLDPTTKKQRGQKLVWDPSLKRLCWLLGESFTKVSRCDEDVYGKVYLERKAREIEKE
jgi:hypothetical protein